MTDLTKDLDRTLFVEAGAGTGKTKSLVDRIVALVKAGHPMRGIAAITFTEAAASELRDRIGKALSAAGETDAVHDLDEAAISTLHGFAQRILTEHPFEAGLPPRVDVLDEIQSTLAFDERWGAFLDRLFQQPNYETVILRATALAMSFDDQLRQVARIFNDHWDRLAATQIVPSPLSPIDTTEVVAALEHAIALRQFCTSDGDRLAVHIDGLAGLPARMRAAGDELEALHLLQSVDRFTAGNSGQGQNYSGCNIDDIKAALKAADAAKADLLTTVRAEVLDHLLVAVREFVLDAAAARQRAGRLEFHDLLVRARDLVESNLEVRAALGARYSHLLIDEFQDTDPIQVELASYIAGDVPGKLFYVGDGKQSIYRFRRADIELFQSVRDALDADNIKSLTDNYRSVPGIVAWVNSVFGELLREPAYAPLAPTRAAPKRSSEPPVVLLGREWEKGRNIAAIREDEAAEIADAIGRLQADHHLRLQEIAILMPTRTSLPQLELALQDAGYPYRVASASLVWATQEIRDLLAVLRVVDDPSDQLSLVAALRSPALACGDDDLLTYRQAGGAWHLIAPTPGSLAPEHPVVAGMAALRSLHEQRWWVGVSGMVDRVVRDLRFFELAVAHPRPRDRWRRLRWVLDQARAFEADGAGSLRDFLSWADLQADENARVKESAVPESDDDAVLIYTVHGAKGLQFPAVILTGLNRPPVNMSTMAAVHWGEKRPEVKTTQRFRTDGFAALDEAEQIMDEHERMRLLYVAATRAQDHLIVSLHRKFNDAKSHAAILARVCASAPELSRQQGHRQLVMQAPPSVSPPELAADAALRRREWEAHRVELIGAASAARVRAATSIAGDHVSDRIGGGAEVDIDTPPWKKGRAGTSVGRAVHATLQTVDLATGENLAAIASAQATAEGVEDRLGDIERLAAAALASQSVRAAVASTRFWRELYVAAPLGDTLVEGFIDLLYDSPDGLVVVDYKTDSVRTPAEVDAAVGRYRLQGATYAVALEHTLGRPVAAVRFVFTSGGGPSAAAVERDVHDLAAAKAEVLAAL
jgi:ATP-dependent exoDNAse (exonuclease V) beta subunit